MSDEVTLGEVARKLDALIERFDVQARDWAARYQPRDLAEAIAANLQARITDLNVEIERVDKRVDRTEGDITANRRLVLGALVYPLLVAIIAALILAAIHQ